MKRRKYFGILFLFWICMRKATLQAPPYNYVRCVDLLADYRNGYRTDCVCDVTVENRGAFIIHVEYSDGAVDRSTQAVTIDFNAHNLRIRTGTNFKIHIHGALVKHSPIVHLLSRTECASGFVAFKCWGTVGWFYWLGEKGPVCELKNPLTIPTTTNG